MKYQQDKNLVIFRRSSALCLEQHFKISATSHPVANPVPDRYHYPACLLKPPIIPYPGYKIQ